MGGMNDEDFTDRAVNVAANVRLGMNCNVITLRDEESDMLFYQIQCYRVDAITGKSGYGYGGRGYVNPRMSDGDLVKTIFGLYKTYWEHEARETFLYQGTRLFGPHISLSGLMESAHHIDIPSAQHVGSEPR